MRAQQPNECGSLALPDPGVILVAEAGERRDKLAENIRRMATGSRIEMARSVLDAARLSAHGWVDLLLIDLVVGTGCVARLEGHLARVAPHATVLVFAESAHPRWDEHSRVWMWSDFDHVFREWLNAFHYRLRNDKEGGPR